MDGECIFSNLNISYVDFSRKNGGRAAEICRESRNKLGCGKAEEASQILCSLSLMHVNKRILTFALKNCILGCVHSLLFSQISSIN
jgi:hypothetical protein